jgi:hypothetical protein
MLVVLDLPIFGCRSALEGDVQVSGNSKLEEIVTKCGMKGIVTRSLLYFLSLH